MLCSCTIVRIQDANSGNVEVTHHFGIASIEIMPGQHTTIVEATGIGVVSGFQGFALGYQDLVFAAVGSGDCRIVVWFQSGEQFEQLKKTLGERSEICAVSANDQPRRKP